MFQVFVAIPFGRRFQAVYETIRVVCGRLGLAAVRVDEVVGAGDVYQLIEREIARSDLVVADCTGDVDVRVTNPNVALEVGLARALRKVIVLLTQSFDSLPFDLRTQRALCYDDSTDGLSELGNRLQSMVQGALRHLEYSAGNSARTAFDSDSTPYIFVRVNEFGYEEYFSPIDGREIVFIPGGPCRTGAPAEEIVLPAYFIDKYPVTNEEYARFMAATSYPAPYHWSWQSPVRRDEPVVGVSWEDAHRYARWAEKDLPSSLEWEKAARGSDGRIYPWGNAEPDSSRAAYRAMDGRGPSRPLPVGRLPRGMSPCGCHDLAGNVWEWLEEWREPGVSRWIAGGSVHSEAWALQAAHRFWADPHRFDYPAIGFRCVRRLREAVSPVTSRSVLDRSRAPDLLPDGPSRD